MPTIKPPAVAGSFYPQEATVLQQMLTKFLADKTISEKKPKALIVPHAGYIYSGDVAASGYAVLKTMRDHIQRVLLLGPAHRYRVNGIASVNYEFLATPLGNIKVDQIFLEKLVKNNLIELIDRAFAEEHCLEVQLPFLQILLDQFTIVPLLVGMARIEEIIKILREVWDDEHTLILVSTDLSHYHEYDKAQKNDQQTTRAIEKLTPENIGWDDACGSLPLRALLTLAREKQAIVTTLDQRNSGDTAGPKDRVVGYGSYHVYLS